MHCLRPPVMLSLAAKRKLHGGLAWLADAGACKASKTSPLPSRMHARSVRCRRSSLLAVSLAGFASMQQALPKRLLAVARQ